MPAGSSSQLSLHSLITLAVNLPLSLVIKSILATILLSCLPSPFSLSNSLPKWSPTLTTFSISSSLSPPSTLSHAFSLPSWSRSNTSNVPLHHSSIIDSSHSLSSDGVGVSSQSAPSLQHHQVASTHDRAPSNPSTPLQHKHVDTPIADFEHLLQRIHTISRRKLCTLSYTSPLLGQSAAMPSASNAPASSPSSASMASVSSVPSMSSSSSSFFHHQMVTIPMSSSMADYVGHSFTSNEPCRRTQKCIDLLANVLSGYDPTTDDYQLLMETVRSTAMVENNIYRLSIAWTIKDPSDESLSPGKPLRLRFHMCTRARRKHKPLSKQHDHSNTKHHHHHHQEKKHQHQQHSHQSSCVPYITEEDIWPNHTDTWLSDRLSKILFTKRDYTSKQSLETNSNDTSEWSNIFFDCDDSKWIIAYRALILEPLKDVVPDEDTAADSYSGDMAWFRVKGVITAHVDVTSTDINQCEDPNKPAMDLFDSATGNHSQDATFRYRVERDQRMLQHQQLATQMEIESAVERGSKVEPTKVELEMMMEIPQNSQIEQVKEQEEEVDQHDQTSMEKLPSWIVLNLYGTHKCHIENSKCEFQSGHGMFRGGYQCKCKDGFHSAVTNLGPTFNGTVVEQSFQDKNPSYDYMFYCKRCAQGCDVCADESPCLSSYDWGFRISLLTITIFCIIFVFLLVFNIYRYRRLKVIKVASPIFLCITLIGCAIMYCETVAIFPVLDAGTCVLTKWTRNFGFCITYSALLLKTWRVSLTYRVKSAHKIKLTDKQLLQWLFPILLVMAIYLGAWTISDTPQAVYIVDWNNLKYKQCDYNWWDHSLLIGEFFFLLWGIKVCYNVRNAESLFNEAKYITWAIYNITLVNIIMILLHLSILPNSGPDIKYFFGFVRTQLSTTTTVILIFGPKFYRVIKGQGDLWDTQIRARGIAASFSFNGVGLAHEETTDLYQENEELKEEIQKLAAQLEIMKICQMEFKNRHLKFSKQHQQANSD